MTYQVDGGVGGEIDHQTLNLELDSLPDEN